VAFCQKRGATGSLRRRLPTIETFGILALQGEETAASRGALYHGAYRRVRSTKIRRGGWRGSQCREARGRDEIFTQ
jgi:hypothetical protein